MKKRPEHSELLMKFLSGESLDRQEIAELAKLIKNDALEDACTDVYEEIWEKTDSEMDDSLQKEMYHELFTRIGPEVQPVAEIRKKPQSKIRSLYIVTSGIAAVILCILAFAAGVNYMGMPAGEVTVKVKNGQKAEVDLPDGTTVFLNSASVLTYDNRFNKKDRVVNLDGEAYFKIAPDRDKPFTVKGIVDVVALGTTFNIKSYESDRASSVVLIEGKVRVENGEHKIVLQPMERLEYDAVNRKMIKTELHANSSDILWLNNELDVNGESTEEICKTLTRMYNVEFVFRSEDVKQDRFKGLIKNNSLENVLNTVCGSAGSKYKKIKDDVIEIYR